MSRAFVKEPEGDVIEDIPDRPISPHPNFVTARGLSLIVGEIARLEASLAEAAAQPEPDGRKLAEFQRDLRYWRTRRATAEVVAPPTDDDEVRFGHRVTIEREDGRRLSYRIVGEDEADPSKGLLSHLSPLAVAMFGRPVGSAVSAGNTDAEIVAID